MKYFFLPLPALLLTTLGVLSSTAALAQSSCSSDGVKPLLRLTERFISADCASCWTRPVPATGKGLILDWIVPSTAGEDAALSAAATGDAQARLAALALVLEEQLVHQTIVPAQPAYILRVAHGLAVNNYVGTSIELTKHPKSPKHPKHPRQAHRGKSLDTFLLLLEHIPKGAADSPEDRLMVRNMLQESWNLATQPHVLSRRPMSIPAGANPDNLRVVGWIQDDQGRVLAMAQSRCVPNS
jgi:hypothetical protein